MEYEGIPVRVERELNSAGDETGKFVFNVNGLHDFYYPDFDPDRMEYHLERAGYTYREFRVMIREMERQYEALNADPHEQDDPPQAKEKGKPKGKSDEPPPAADPPATE